METQELPSCFITTLPAAQFDVSFFEEEDRGDYMGRTQEAFDAELIAIYFPWWCAIPMAKITQFSQTRSHGQTAR